MNSNWFYFFHSGNLWRYLLVLVILSASEKAHSQNGGLRNQGVKVVLGQEIKLNVHGDVSIQQEGVFENKGHIRLSRDWINHSTERCFSEEKEIICVGENGTIIRSVDGGKTWITCQTGTTAPIEKISAPSETVAYAAGASGTILKSTDGGITWVNVSDSSITMDLTDVQFIDEETGFVIGESGELLSTVDGGQTWQPLSTGTTKTLNSLTMVDDTTMFIASDDGEILKSVDGGQTWVMQPTPVTDNIRAIEAYDPQTCIAVGDNGTIIKTEDGGITWSTRASGTTETLRSLSCHCSGESMIVGDQGTILRSSDAGDNWVQVSSTTTEHLHDIRFSEKESGEVVGSNGTFLKTRDGGLTFEQHAPVAEDLRGVDSRETKQNGVVELFGNNDQNIKGNYVTFFEHLWLKGSGIKRLNINSKVGGVLELNDIEFATAGFSLDIMNPDPQAINVSSGFINSDAGGRLGRVMNRPEFYLFPVGSATGTPRYRPVAIKPLVDGLHHFRAGMVNNDPDADGYDISLREDGTMLFNPDYYHLITPDGANAKTVDIKVYFDESVDGEYASLAKWDGMDNQWKKLESSSSGNDNQLGFSFVKGPLNAQALAPVALMRPTPEFSYQIIGPNCDEETLGEIIITQTGGIGFSNVNIKLTDFFSGNIIHNSSSAIIQNLLPGIYTLEISGTLGNNSFYTSKELTFGYDLEYTDLVNAVVTGTEIDAIGVPSGGHGGFASENRLLSQEDGWIAFKYHDFEEKHWWIGLSEINADETPATIEYGFEFREQEFDIIENGAIKLGNHPLADEDEFIIIRQAGIIQYWYNRIMIYSSLTSSSTQLIVDGSLAPHAKLKDVISSFCYCKLVLAPSEEVTICSGQAIQLSATGSDAYLWSPSTGLSCTNCSDPVAAPSVTTEYTVTVLAGITGEVCAQKTLNVIVEEDCGQGTAIINFSFNNYGVHVNTEIDFKINVHGDVLNEIGGSGTGGFFNNKGEVRLTDNWINNGLNDAFVLGTNGRVELFGAYQKITGNSATVFPNLLLTGYSKKEMFIDASVERELDLTSSELATRAHVFYVLDNNPNAVERTSGYVSGDQDGLLSRQMLKTEQYLFPVGSGLGIYRYRPVYITNDDFDDEFLVRMINHDPAIDVLITKAPNVDVVNDLYYHWIERAPGSPAVNSEPVNIEFLFDEALDGDFQNIVHWDDDNIIAPPVTGPLWQSTSSIQVIQGTPFSTVETSGWNDFVNEQFALAKAGFVINTGGFGNPSGTSGGGTTMTISGGGLSGTSGSGGTSSGGGTFNTGNGNADGSGGDIFTPNPLGGTYTITVNGNDENTDGEITFEVDNSGNISNVQVQGNDGNDYDLADDLYDVLDDNVLDLHSEPKSDLPECESVFSIMAGNANPMILNKGAFETFHISLDLTASEINELRIYERGNASPVLTQQDGSPWSAAGANPGVYRFELEVNTTAGTHVFHGQFLIEN